MTTIEYYYKKLEIDTKRKYDKNDLLDLFNLVYVQPGYKYLTSENKWNNLSKENRQIDDYLIRITPHNRLSSRKAKKPIGETVMFYPKILSTIFHFHFRPPKYLHIFAS